MKLFTLLNLLFLLVIGCNHNQARIPAADGTQASGASPGETSSQFLVYPAPVEQRVITERMRRCNLRPMSAVKVKGLGEHCSILSNWIYDRENRTFSCSIQTNLTGIGSLVPWPMSRGLNNTNVKRNDDLWHSISVGGDSSGKIELQAEIIIPYPGDADSPRMRPVEERRRQMRSRDKRLTVKGAEEWAESFSDEWLLIYSQHPYDNHQHIQAEIAGNDDVDCDYGKSKSSP